MLNRPSVNTAGVNVRGKSRLQLIRATMAFKGPKVVTQGPWRDTSQRHFGLAVRANYLLQLGHGAPLKN